MRSHVGNVFERSLAAVETVWISSWAFVDGFSFRTVGHHLGPEAEAVICAADALGHAYTLGSLLDSSISELGRPGLSKPGGGTSSVTINLLN